MKFFMDLKNLAFRAFRTIHYRIFRRFMPYKRGFYNHVQVPAVKLFDQVLNINNFPKNRPTYEKGLVNALKREVEEDDSVTVIGGGYGVTAVWAARMNRNPEKVTVYEASGQQFDKLQKTLRYEGLEDVNAVHAGVGQLGELYGKIGDLDRMPASDLDSCNVLEIDVEGAELEILEDLQIRPETIIVESHGRNGCSTEKVKQKLRSIGYTIGCVEWAESCINCKGRDVKTIIGHFSSGDE